MAQTCKTPPGWEGLAKIFPGGKHREINTKPLKNQGSFTDLEFARESDRRFFRRFPERRHYVRAACRSEVANLHRQGQAPLPQGAAWFAPERTSAWDDLSDYGQAIVRSASDSPLFRPDLDQVVLMFPEVLTICRFLAMLWKSGAMKGAVIAGNQVRMQQLGPVLLMEFQVQLLDKGAIRRNAPAWAANGPSGSNEIMLSASVKIWMRERI